VGAPEASFTFSGLNGDSDISYIIRGRWVKATAADVAMKVRPNNDSTANYDSEFLYGQDGTALAFKSAADNGLLLDYHLANAGVGTFDAVLYAKTGFKRSMTTRGGSADNANTNYSAFAPQT